MLTVSSLLFPCLCLTLPLQASDRAHYFSSPQSTHSRKRGHRLCLHFPLMLASTVVWFLPITVLKGFSPEASLTPVPWPPAVFLFLISPQDPVFLVPSPLTFRPATQTPFCHPTAPNPQALPGSVSPCFLHPMGSHISWAWHGTVWW